MPTIHKNIVISGRVQGVFFRASALKKAGELGLKGTVANRPDGTVYAEAEGRPAKVDAFIAWCEKGPPAAAVKNITVSQGPVKGFPDFHIIR